MINDFFGDVRARILQHFPERQLYLHIHGFVVLIHNDKPLRWFQSTLNKQPAI